MKLDKNAICDSIKKARPQDLMLVTTNQSDKDSKKNALIDIEKNIRIGNIDIVLIRKN
jgi:hypothetical protein